jgi:hypothetical protein
MKIKFCYFYVANKSDASGHGDVTCTISDSGPTEAEVEKIRSGIMRRWKYAVVVLTNIIPLSDD